MSTQQANLDKIDVLIEQVGHLTEGLTEIKMMVQEQAETSKRQAETTDRLVRIVEMLLQNQQGK